MVHGINTLKLSPSQPTFTTRQLTMITILTTRRALGALSLLLLNTWTILFFFEEENDETPSASLIQQQQDFQAAFERGIIPDETSSFVPVRRHTSVRTLGGHHLDSLYKEAAATGAMTTQSRSHLSSGSSSNNNKNAAFGRNVTLSRSKDIEHRPRLVLHVGPQKTGTTSLQTDLTRFRRFLLADGFHYEGRFYHPYVNRKGRTINNRSGSAIVNDLYCLGKAKNKSLSLQRQCLERVKADLAIHYQRKENVLLSDESMSNWTNQIYNLIKEVLGDQWRVEVMVTYRHYYEWILSKKFQSERVDRRNPVKFRWKHEKGWEPVPLIPHWKKPNRWNAPDLQQILEQIDNTFPFTFINMHSPSPLRTTLLCDASLQTPQSCTKSRKIDISEPSSTTIMNTQKAVVDHRFYDAIAFAAVEKGMVNTSLFSRDEVRKGVEQHQEKILGLSAKDFAMACPKEAELKELLDFSLSVETNILPGSNATTLAEHKSGFREKIVEKEFCWVDTSTILAMEEWQTFFDSMQRAKQVE